MRFFITGGAGFLSSNLVNTILDRRFGAVTVFDNFLTGRREHFGARVAVVPVDFVGALESKFDLIFVGSLVTHFNAIAFERALR